MIQKTETICASGKNCGAWQLVEQVQLSCSLRGETVPFNT